MCVYTVPTSLPFSRNRTSVPGPERSREDGSIDRKESLSDPTSDLVRLPTTPTQSLGPGRDGNPSVPDHLLCYLFFVGPTLYPVVGRLPQWFLDVQTSYSHLDIPVKVTSLCLFLVSIAYQRPSLCNKTSRKVYFVLPLLPPATSTSWKKRYGFYQGSLLYNKTSRKVYLVFPLLLPIY